MQANYFIRTLMALFLTLTTVNAGAENWPDGTKIDSWFANTSKVDVNTLGKQYVITDYGVSTDSTIVQTAAIQAVIDKASENGGGVIVIPRGTFITGSLFFKPKTHLHLVEGAKLKGSDRITNFKILETRIEGETCPYFAAVINADHVDGFTITGKGTIDGNGYTLTVNYNIEDDYGIMSPAPFRFVTNAYIMNLHVNGTITASTTPQITQFPGGLVGRILASLDDPSSLRTI